jgi:hypothetical protein
MGQLQQWAQTRLLSTGFEFADIRTTDSRDCFEIDLRKAQGMPPLA